jgi:hypothetical protein
MTNFYGTISATADAYVVNSNADTVLGSFGGITAPISTPMQGSTKAFALSFQEAALYLSATFYSGGSSGPSSVTAINNWGKLNDETISPTWLRSYGSNSTNTSCLLITGEVIRYSRGNAYYVRPAMWVNADIFVTAAPVTP